jgi:hypothetical protein
MEQEDNADPEAGPESSQAQSDPKPSKADANTANKSREDINNSLKQRLSDDNRGEIIPLTVKPPPPHTQTLEDESASNHPGKKKKPPVPRLIHP